MSYYLLFSDLHFHDWSAFASVDADGVNTRLRATLSEMDKVITKAMSESEFDGRVFIAGDVFHVRGRVKPSVLNPVLEFFRKKTLNGIAFYMIPGNHDLEGKETTKMGSSIEALGEIKGVNVYNAFALVGNVCMVPWHSDHHKMIDDISEKFKNLAGVDASTVDLIIHAPVNGVIKGIPDSGLHVDRLKKLKMKRVFAGHYHNHKNFGGGVYSIGAFQHQTWSDPGSVAGYLKVNNNDDVVIHCESELPQFINFDEMDDPEESTPGNYVRVRGSGWDSDEIKSIKSAITDLNPKGLIVTALPKPPSSARGKEVVAKGESLEKSLEAYIEALDLGKYEEIKVLEHCQGILKGVRDEIC